MPPTKSAGNNNTYEVQLHTEESPRTITAVRMKFEPNASRVTFYDADDEVVAMFHNPASAQLKS